MHSVGDQIAWRISVSFVLLGGEHLGVGAFDPDELTRTIGIDPARAWAVGTVHHQAGLSQVAPSRTSGWVVRSKEADSASLEDHVESVLDQLTPARERVRLAISQYRASLECSVAVGVGPGPLLILGAEQLARLAELGLRVGFDLDRAEPSDDIGAR